MGPSMQHTLGRCQKFRQWKCNHEKETSANYCIKKVVGPENEEGFLVASQDENVSKFIKYKSPKTPLLYFFNKNILRIQDMGEETRKMISSSESQFRRVPAEEIEQIRKSQ